MPFLGRDWRSDGDIWVRTNHGWETLRNWNVKIHESINHNVLQRLLRQSIHSPSPSQDMIDCSQRALYLRVPKSSPCKISNGQSAVMFTQVVSTLDFAGAFQDTRRCGYVYKIVEILVKNRLLRATGAVLNQLLTLLDSAVHAVSLSQTRENKRKLTDLLESLLRMLNDNPYEFEHLGGSWQWTKCHQQVKEMLTKVNNLDLPARRDDGRTLNQLPQEVLRGILLYLSTQEDVINAGKASEEVNAVVSDGGLWRDLCSSHFNKTQLSAVLQQRSWREKHRHGEVAWYNVYVSLCRRYGVAESYADSICWCSRCRSLFWKSTGHPCKYEIEEDIEDVTPCKLVAMFDV